MVYIFIQMTVWSWAYGCFHMYVQWPDISVCLVSSILFWIRISFSAQISGIWLHWASHLTTGMLLPLYSNLQGQHYKFVTPCLSFMWALGIQIELLMFAWNAPFVQVVTLALTYCNLWYTNYWLLKLTWKFHLKKNRKNTCPLNKMCNHGPMLCRCEIRPQYASVVPSSTPTVSAGKDSWLTLGRYN